MVACWSWDLNSLNHLCTTIQVPYQRGFQEKPYYTRVIIFKHSKFFQNNLQPYVNEDRWRHDLMHVFSL